MNRPFSSRLLASTSLIAIALAAPRARADDFVIPLGTISASPVVVNTTTPGAPFGSVLNLGGIVVSETTRNSATALTIYRPAISGSIVNSGTVSIVQTLSKLDIHGGGTSVSASGETKGIVLYNSAPLTGGFQNSGSVLVSRNAYADVTVKTSGPVALSEYAYGVQLDSYVAGGIVNANTGVIDVSNDITATLTPSDHYSQLTPVTTVYAYGVIAYDTAAASGFDNAGSIVASARATITHNLTRSLSATVLAASTARAVGVVMSQSGAAMPSGVTGTSMTNSGVIDVISAVTQATNFSVVATSANAGLGRLIQSSAIAFAAGVLTDGAQVTRFQNTGTLSVAGTASVVAVAGVSGPGKAQLINHNSPTSPQTSFESGSVGGSVTAYGVSIADGSLGGLSNSGTIDVSGHATTSLTATATGTTDAVVEQQTFAAVQLTGIDVATPTLTGPVVNSGTVALTAAAAFTSQQTATGTGGATSHKATVDSTGYVQTKLLGISVAASGFEAATYSATVDNSGDITLSATATGSQAGTAQSQGEAVANVGFSAGSSFLVGALLFATNSAAGIEVNAPNVAKVTNSGVIDVSSAFSSGLVATATGGTSAAATANSAAASIGSFGLNIQEVAGGPSAGTVATTQIANSGTIRVKEAAVIANTANAVANLAGGAASATAASQSTVLSTLPGLDGAVAGSYGIYVSLQGLEGSLSNSGVISVAQSLAITDTATANGGGAQAQSVSDGLSLALGLLATPGAVTGTVGNSGSITVAASGSFTATATAAAGTGKASADAGAAGIVFGGGVLLSTSGLAGFENSGRVLVSAANTTQVIASAGGSGNTAATASGEGRALGLGLMLTGSAGVTGSLVNSGDVAVGATASVTAGGAADTLTTTAIANASAIGLLTAGDAAIGGDLSNSGRILALANAAAVASGGTGNAQSSAYAYGIAINAAGGIGGSISNTGFIGAAAEATATGSSSDATAVAMGLQIARGSIGGSITNSGTIAADASGTDVTVVALALGTSLDGKTISSAESTVLTTLGTPATLAAGGAVTVASGVVNSGLISANAFGTQSASATAISVAGGSIIGALTNTGTIKATASGGSATAIDLTGEGGATQVFLKDGGVIGDIALSSHYADAVVWSGGTFSGDVFGGGMGNLSVVSGASGSFAYAGTLESLEAVTVGGSGTPVALAFTGAAVGIGTFTVANGGSLLLPADSAISTSHYVQASGGTLGVYLSPEWTSAPISATSASLSGTLAVEGAAGLRSRTTTYDLVNSSDIDGAFTQVTTPNSLLSANVVYDANGAELVLTRDATTSLVGLNASGRSLAAGIDLGYARLSLSSPLSPVIDSFYSGSDAQVATLINQMSGAPLAQAKSAGTVMFGTVNGQISQQLAATRDLPITPGGGSAVLSYAGGQVNLEAPGPWAGLADAPGSGAASTSGVWLRPFGSWGRASTGDGTVSTSGGGVLGGVERAFGDDVRGGAVFSYQTADLSFTLPASGSIDQWTASLYVERQWGPLYANLFGTYGYQTYDMSRSIAYGGSLFTARSGYSGNAGAVVGEMGYDYAFAASSRFEPYIRLAYAALSTDAVVERGAGVFNLATAADTTNSLQSTLGLRLIQPLALLGVPLAVRLEAGWQHEYLDANASLGATFLADSTISFGILSNGPRDQALAAAGLSFAFSPSLDGYLEYRGSWGDSYSNSTASAQLRLRF